MTFKRTIICATLWLMKRLVAPFFVVLALGGCSQTPYKIIDKTAEGPLGLVIKVRVDVPASATREEMQSWCDAITKDEKGEGIVTVEFLEEGIGVRQRGLCTGNQLFTNR